MKTQLSSLLAAGAAGVALIATSNASFLAALPGETLIATLAGLAVLGIAIADYARRPSPLAPRPAAIHRVAVAAAGKTTAYGVRRCSAIVERSAA